MSTAALLHTYEDQGLFLWEDGGKLKFLYDGDALPDDLRQELTLHKPELLAHLLRAQAQSFPMDLTGLQQAYWLGEQDVFSDAAPAYVHVVYAGDLPAPQALQASLSRLIDEHPPLSFTLDPSEPRFRRMAHAAVRVETVRARTGHSARQCAALPGDPIAPLSAGQPLLRVILVDDGAECCLHAVFRLVLFDAYSVHLILSRLLADGSANPPAHPTRPPVAWQSDQTSSRPEARRRSRSYWEAKIPLLSPGPRLPLLKHRSKPQARRDGGAGGQGGHRRFVEHRYTVSPEAYSAFKLGCGLNKVSVNVALLTAYLETLARWSALASVSASVMYTRRSDLPAAHADAIGNFSNTVLISLPTDDTSFAGRAAGVQADLYAALKHDALDGVSVIRRWIQSNDHRSSSIEPPMPYVFSSLLDLGASGLPLTQTDHAISTPQIWLDAQAAEQDGALCLSWYELSDTFPQGVIRQAFDHFTQTIERLASTPPLWDQHDLPLPASSLDVLDSFNLAARQPFQARTLFDGLAVQAQARPHAPAVLGPDGSSLSFSELLIKASQLASHLNEKGVGPSDNVVVLGEKNAFTVIALYAVLMAGATYVPVSKGTPPLRIHLINKQAATTTVLGDDDNEIEQARSSPVNWTLNYRRFLEALDEASEYVEPAYPVDPDERAYIIFTSGSTGTPKGVVISHASAMNTLLDLQQRFSIEPSDRILAVSEFSFDLSVFDLFMPAVAGASVILPTQGTKGDPAPWLAAAAVHGATIWNSVPAIMDMALTYTESMGRGSDMPERVRLWMASGDWIPLSLPQRLTQAVPGSAFISLGGATEASIWSNWYPVTRVDPEWNSIPYGMPLSNQRFYVLDPQGRRCPPLVAGMLHIGGDGLAQGYVNDPAKTAAAFFDCSAVGERLYKTGDLGRYFEDGVLEFLGRADQQVKINGFRVELAEVESVLCQHPEVAHAVVLLSRQGLDSRLCAFVVKEKSAGAAEPPLPSQEASLLRFAAERLPAYMLPGRIYQIEALPLTSNGKVDRRVLEQAVLALQAGQMPNGVLLGPTEHSAAVSAPSPDASAADPMTEMVQQAVCSVFPAAAHHARSWFDLGCSSLQAVYILHAVNGRFGLDLTLADIYAHPTSAALARRIAKGQPFTRNALWLAGHEAKDRPPLVLVHPVGGAVSCYQELVQEVASHYRVAALCADAQQAFNTIEAMAEAYVQQVLALMPDSKDIVVAGWSLGGVVALEMGRALSEKHGVACTVVTIDSMVPPPGSTSETEISHQALFTQFLEQMEGAPAGRDDSTRAPHLTDPLVNSRFALFERNYRTLLRYRFRPSPCPEWHWVAGHCSNMPGLVPLASQLPPGQSGHSLQGSDHQSVLKGASLQAICEHLAGLIGAKTEPRTSQRLDTAFREASPYDPFHKPDRTQAAATATSTSRAALHQWPMNTRREL